MTDRELACLACLQPYTPYPSQNLEDYSTGNLHDLYKAQRSAYLAKRKAPTAPANQPPKPIPHIIPVELLSPVDRKAKFERITDVIHVVTGVTREELLGRSRFRRIVKARRLFCYYARESLGCSSSQTADFLGLDHSSVVHHIGMFREKREDTVCFEVEMDRIFGAEIEKLRQAKAAYEAAVTELQT